MTAKRVDEDEGEVEVPAQGTSAPVAKKAAKEDVPPQGDTSPKSAEHAKDGNSEGDDGWSDNNGPGYGRPTKDNHLLFGPSTITERNFENYKDWGYLDDVKHCRTGGSDITPVPRDGEIVLFESFFVGGLRLPMNDFTAEVLESFEVFFHQLTPNAFVRLSVFAWALASQGLQPSPEAFCRSHQLCFQTKKDKVTGQHLNFGCYSFETLSGSVGPVVACKSKWGPGWTQKWFYYRVDPEF